MNLQDFKISVESRISSAMRDGVVPGGVFGLLLGSEEYIWPFGFNSYPEAQLRKRWSENPPMGLSELPAECLFPPVPLKSDQIFDCASITKSIPLAILTLNAMESGLIHLESSLDQFFPEWKSRELGRVQIKHLLTHTVDFRFSLGENIRQGRTVMDSIESHSFQSPPGEVYCYSNTSSHLLTFVLERLYGQTFADLAFKEVFEPIGMSASSFGASNSVAVEYCPWRSQIVSGVVHDESAYSLLPNKSGAAGLFANVSDLLKAMRYLESKITDHSAGMSTFYSNLLINQIPKLGTTSLGMEFKESRFMGEMGQRLNTIGKTGFTGCHWQLAPEEQLGLVFLSNHPWPRRMRDASLINALRSDLGTLVLKLL